MFQNETFVNDKMKRDNLQQPWSHDHGNILNLGYIMKSDSQSRTEYIARTRQARLHADKKQEEVADAIGVDRATYTNYEKRRAMPQKYIAKFCVFTGVASKWLLNGEGDMLERSDPHFEKWQRLSEKEQATFDAMIDQFLHKKKGAHEE